MVKNQIPSTQTLRAFEAVAKCGNCTQAAKDLFLTTSTVSKQLKILESNLDVKLFTRTKYGMTLTHAGQIYLEEIQPAMAKLASAGGNLNIEQFKVNELSIWVLLVFLDKWLLSRISDFSTKNPDIHINFKVSTEKEWTPGGFDAYFRSGDGVWPNYISDYICGSQIIIVGSPKLLQRMPKILTLSDLTQFNLYENLRVPPSWATIFGKYGINPGKKLNIIKWEFYSLVIHCACLGLGLALVPKCYVQEEIANNYLVRVLDFSVYSAIGCYFVVPDARSGDPLITRFRNWLLTIQGDGEDPSSAERMI